MKNRNKYLKMLVFAPVGIAGLALFTFILRRNRAPFVELAAAALFGLPAISVLAGGSACSCWLESCWRIRRARPAMHGGIGARVSDRIADRIADRVADRVGERVQGLSPEERERFTQRLRERWGAAPTSNENSGP
jgi:hypothetical protein